MENEIIKNEKFDNAKNNIQELSRKVPSFASFKSFQTQGTILPFNEHSVTGNEINEYFVSPLQSTIISQNEHILNLFSVVKEVYKALDSLDKDYIQGILRVVEAAQIAHDQATTASSKAEIASGQALDASKEALDASTKANKAQTDINRTIEALKITISALKDFKDKVTKELNSISNLTIETNSVKQKVKDIEQTCGNISSQIISIKREFKNYGDHLNEMRNDITALHKYRTLLESYSHLSDIDTIWSDVESHKSNLSELHKQVDNFISETHESIISINKSIEELKEQSIKRDIIVDKKIKIAYGIAAGSVTISVIHLILQLVGVL